MKILVLIPTKDTVDPKTLEALMAQDFKDFSVLINPKKPDAVKTRIQNIIENRKELKEKALKHDAEYFFWLDSDVILPPTAFSQLMKEGKPLMGAAYQLAPNHWTTSVKCGEVEHLGFGALMMNREVLSAIEIRAEGTKCECAMFCEDAKKLGYTPVALNIQCGHNQKPGRLGFAKIPVELLQTVIKLLQESNHPAKDVNKLVSDITKITVSQE